MSESAPGPRATEDPAEQRTPTDDGVLKVYAAGPVTVPGCGGHYVPSKFNAANYRAAINQLLIFNNSKIVAFDLTGVHLLPSGMPGLLVSLSRMGEAPPRVQVLNAGADIREVLTLTRFNAMIEVCE